jgi:hypothetical protein
MTLPDKNIRAQAEDALNNIGAQVVTGENGEKVLRHRWAPIEKTHVLNLDISDIDILTDLVRTDLLQKRGFQLWDLTISGYDEDPRGLFEIPEVRKWFIHAIDRAPYLIAIISPAALRQVVLSLLDVQVVGHSQRTQIEAFEEKVIEKASEEISQGDQDRFRQVEKSLQTAVTFKILTSKEVFKKIIGNCLFSAYQFFESCGIDHSRSEEMVSAVISRIQTFIPKNAFPLE